VLHLPLRCGDQRHAADGLSPEAPPGAGLAALSARLSGELLPHQAEEERALYPAAARRLGGQDPLAALIRMHAEIELLSERVAMLLAHAQRGGDWGVAAPELRRTLFALEALLRLHLVAEEEVLMPLAAEAR
jgi:iron-sulfur cluster repair protein YtfE (RIC family)